MTTNHMLMESAVRDIVGDQMASAVMEAYSVCFEADGGAKKDYEALRKMAIRLLAASNAFNVMHWNVDTNTKHTLLNEVYELCRDTGDTMAETYMSATEKPCLPDDGDDMGAEGGFDEGSALSRIKAIQAEMQECCSANPGFSEGIKNIFADFDESITSVIYKYQQFKS